MNSEIITLQNICYSYGHEEVLCSVSFDIHQGDFVGIIGPNGSGKTTLLKIILGLIKAQNGEVKMFGTTINKFKDWKKIGYVPQKMADIQSKIPMTIYELASLESGSTPASVNDALKSVGLHEIATKPLSELSGGQLQRTFMAKALAAKPEVLILDEPTSGVDVETQDEFYKLLSNLNQQGLTLILVSHDIDVVVSEVNKLICLNKKVVYDGSPREFAKDELVEKLYGSTRRMVIHKH